VLGKERVAIGQGRIYAWQSMIPRAMKGGVAILDQGLTTGSGFLIGILLARWLTREQYGSFAVSLSVVVFLTMLYQSFLLEPMSVYGGAVYHDHLRSYLRALLWLQLCIGIVLLLLLGMSAEVMRLAGHSGGLPGALAGAALAAPCILLVALAKRALYLRLSPVYAIAAALLYAAVVLGGLFLAHAFGLASPFVAFLLMGIGAALASALLLFSLRTRLEGTTIDLRLWDILKKHWSYGRWALAGAAAMWVPYNIYYFFGVAQAGELKALMNFYAPVLQSCGALSLLLLPYAARAHHQGESGGRLAWKISLLCGSGTIVYWAVVMVFRERAFRFLYSGRYMEVTDLVGVVALGSICWSAFFGPAIVLRAMESPASVFAAACASSLFCLAVGIPITRAFGLRGAVWSMTVSEIIGLITAVVLLQRAVARDHPRASVPSSSTQLPVVMPLQPTE
jgi:O-antigen/teichoic acid export membrane protein